MTPRTAWRGCAAAGIVAFVCSSSFGRIPGMVACGPTGGLGPIIAFEFARTPTDVAALFGSGPCTATLVAAQKTGVLLDALGFIPSYTAFLILATIAARFGMRGQIAMIVTLILAAIGDQIEGVLLYAILRDLPGTPALLGPLGWVVHAKFALLALGTVGLGAALARRSLPGALFGAVIVFGGLVALYGLISMLSAVMMTGFLFGWVTLLIVALIASFSSLFAARAGRLPGQALPSA